MKSIHKWTTGGLLTAGLVAAGFVAASSGLLAQNPGIKRTVVYTGDVSVPGREARIASVEIAPGANAGRHTHPGEELSYVLEGTVLLEVTGQPPRTLHAGDVFFIPPNTIHDGKNVGTGPAKVLATYIVERGKPVATPAK